MECLCTASPTGTEGARLYIGAVTCIWLNLSGKKTELIAMHLYCVAFGPVLQGTSGMFPEVPIFVLGKVQATAMELGWANSTDFPAAAKWR